jgi:MSHA pilin protein MshD
MTSSVQRGSTLIELLFFIVVVSIGVVGILSVMNTTVRFSAEPMARKQAMVLAESILEEIVQKDYAYTGLLVPPPVDASRDTMDDVDDFHNLETVSVESIFTDAPSGYTMSIVVAESVWIATEDVWSLVPEVGDASNDLPATVLVPVPMPVPVKKITVTVTGKGHTISLSGYRADY